MDYVIKAMTPADASPVCSHCRLLLNSSEGRNSVTGLKSLHNIGEERQTKSLRYWPRKGLRKEKNMVFVLDKHQKPLMPCTEKRARLLLNRKRAVVHKVFPFTIRIKDRIREKVIVEDMEIKIDGGAKYTGIAIITDSSDKPVLCPYLAEIHHKTDIKSKLDTKRAIRKSRRGRKTRYRKKRFLNRKRRAGWLPPSVMAVVQQTESVLNKLFKLLPVKSVVLENVKFDSQLMENAELRGIEYQQGTLSGYEVREYLLEKWGRTCAYCKRKDSTGSILETLKTASEEQWMVLRENPHSSHD